jgi:hypothetical protein
MTDITALRSRVAGPVLGPEDPGFADEVAGFNLVLINTPDVAVGASSTADVVAAVRYARDLGLPARVQATGHGASAAITDGVLITTRRLDTVSIDAATRTATIGAGATWAPVVAAAAELGLSPVTGSSAQVGVVGYLAGGGLGPFVRSHGYSSDYVLGYTVVTGTGDVVEASSSSHPALFWALRGGKRGFGIVVEVRIRLVELPGLYAGSLLFESQHIEAVVRGWLEYTATAPADVSTSLVALRFPPIDAVPEPMRGKNLASLRFAYPGDPAEGERLAAPLRALAPVLQDALGPLAIGGVATIHNDPEGRSPAWSNGTLLSRVDDGFATAFLSIAGPAARVPFVAAELRHLGAAAATDVAEGSAVGGRSGAFALTLIGAPEPSLFENIIPAAAAKVFDTLRPWINDESNVNFSSHGGAGTPNWSADVSARLDAVRAEYDPGRVFG